MPERRQASGEGRRRPAPAVPATPGPAHDSPPRRVDPHPHAPTPARPSSPVTPAGPAAPTPSAGTGDADPTAYAAALADASEATAGPDLSELGSRDVGGVLTFASPAAAALWYWHHQQAHHDMHYEEYRPVHFSRPPAVVTHIDCSAFFILCYYAAGEHDPQGSSFNGYGNTSTLQAHGKHVAVADLKPSDAVFYSNPDHVVIYVGGGYAITMGSEGDPARIGIHYRAITTCRTYGAASKPQPETAWAWNREVATSASHLTSHGPVIKSAHRALHKLFV